MPHNLRSQKEINLELQKLFEKYQNQRLTLNWLNKYISLKTEYNNNKWSHVIPSFIIIVLSIIFLIKQNFRLQILIQVYSGIYLGTYNEFTILKFLECMIFFILIYFLTDFSEYLLYPILLVLRCYKVRTTFFDEKNYSKGSASVIFFIYIIMLFLLKLYSPISSYVPFIVLLIGLLVILSIIILILFPGYVWNGLLHELVIPVHNEENGNEDYVLRSYSSITEDIEMAILFLFEKKRSFIYDNQDNVVYFKGYTSRDFKILNILVIFDLFLTSLLFLFYDNKSFVYYNSMILIISGIGTSIYYFHIQTLFKIKFLKRGSIKVNLKLYSQVLTEINLTIPNFQYNEHKGSKQFIKHETSGYLYLERQINFKVSEEYKIEANEQLINFKLTDKLLTKKSRRVIPKNLEIILNIKEKEEKNASEISEETF